jgi:hypothetical protein
MNSIRVSKESGIGVKNEGIGIVVAAVTGI